MRGNTRQLQQKELDAHTQTWRLAMCLASPKAWPRGSPRIRGSRLASLPTGVYLEACRFYPVISAGKQVRGEEGDSCL